MQSDCQTYFDSSACQEPNLLSFCIECSAELFLLPVLPLVRYFLFIILLMDTPSQTAQAKTRELLNKKNRYRSGLGFKDNGQNSDLKRNVIDEVKIKKKIVGDIKKLK